MIKSVEDISAWYWVSYLNNFSHELLIRISSYHAGMYGGPQLSHRILETYKNSSNSHQNSSNLHEIQITHTEFFSVPPRWRTEQEYWQVHNKIAWPFVASLISPELYADTTRTASTGSDKTGRCTNEENLGRNNAECLGEVPQAARGSTPCLLIKINTNIHCKHKKRKQDYLFLLKYLHVTTVYVHICRDESEVKI